MPQEMMELFNLIRSVPRYYIQLRSSFRIPKYYYYDIFVILAAGERKTGMDVYCNVSPEKPILKCESNKETK